MTVSCAQAGGRPLETAHSTSFRNSPRCARMRSSRLDHAPAYLILLDRFEERLEVAFAESLVALALDELEEHRPELVLRKDLQENLSGRAVDQDVPFLKLFQALAVAGN